MSDNTLQLTAEQIQFFHENGFLAIDRITAADDVDRIRAIYDDLFARRVGHESGDHFDLAGTDDDTPALSLPQILSPSRYAPSLRETGYFRNAAAIARQLLGEHASFQGDHAILKPASHGAATPWHQDEAYWDPGHVYHAVSVWMPLQEATLDNGCMHFIPGTHRLEVLPHHPINHDPRIHGLEIDAVDESAAVPCPLPPGGATFHLSRTLHYASPNKTQQPRRAYILGFGCPPRKLEAPRDFYWLRQQNTARNQRAREKAAQSAQS